MSLAATDRSFHTAGIHLSSGKAGATDILAAPPSSQPFEATLSEEERWRLAGIRSSLDVTAGAVVFDEGDEVRTFFNVSSGVFMLYKLLPDGRRLVNDFAYPGDFAGLTFDAHHGYGVEACTDGKLLCMPRQRVEAVMERLPQLEFRLFSVVCRSLREAHDRMLLLGRKTAAERLASFLIDLSRRAELRGESATSLWVPMNRAAIGDHVGLTLETVCRVFSAFKRQQLISLRRGAVIELIDPPALADLAEGF